MPFDRKASNSQSKNAAWQGDENSSSLEIDSDRTPGVIHVDNEIKKVNSDPMGILVDATKHDPVGEQERIDA